MGSLDSIVTLVVLMLVMSMFGGMAGFNLGDWFKNLFKKEEDEYDKLYLMDSTLEEAKAELKEIVESYGSNKQANATLLTNWLNKYHIIFRGRNMDTEYNEITRIYEQEKQNPLVMYWVDDVEPVIPDIFTPTLIDDRTIWHVQFTAYDKTEHEHMVDFFGYSPIGAPDIDTYLSKLSKSELDSWRNYWVGVFSNRPDLLEYIENKYNWFVGVLGDTDNNYVEPVIPDVPVSDWPKYISNPDGGIVIDCYNDWQVHLAKDMLGVNSGQDIMVYLVGLDTAGRDSWANYWVSEWAKENRSDIVELVETYHYM